jgi:hypothetical protein
VNKNYRNALVLFVFILLFCPTVHAAPQPAFKLYDEGKELIADYAKYGEFKDVGTENYKYKMKDGEGLAEAVGGRGYSRTPRVSPRIRSSSAIRKTKNSPAAIGHS